MQFREWELRENSNFGGTYDYEYPLCLAYSEVPNSEYDSYRISYAYIPIHNDEDMSVIHELYYLWYNNNWDKAFVKKAPNGLLENEFDFALSTIDTVWDAMGSNAYDCVKMAFENGAVENGENVDSDDCYCTFTAMGVVPARTWEKIETFVDLLRSNPSKETVYNALTQFELFSAYM